MLRKNRNIEFDRAPTVLYLFTDEVSSLFFRGQFSYLQREGFRIVAGARFERPGEARLDPGVKVVSIPFVRDPSPIRDIKALILTFLLIRRVRPDIVNSSTPKAGLLGMVAAWLCRIRVRVYVVRGLRYETASGWRRYSLRTLEKFAMRLATAVVFNSHSLLLAAERDQILRPGRGRVLGAGSGNGIDESRFDHRPTRAHSRGLLGLSPDVQVIGFIGRLSKSKGIEDLLIAFASVLEALPKTELLIVGEYESGDALSSHLRLAIESETKIRLHPWMDNIASAFSAIDILAFPSLREGLPNVVLEAQLCGVPVVAYAATGTVDAVRDGETGILVSVGDTDGLGQVLISLLGDQNLMRQLGSNGSEWVRYEFRSTRVWGELLALYRSEILRT